MKCSTRQEAQDLVIAVRGAFRSQGIVKFCTLFSKLALSEHPRIMIDLAGVNEISFKAVGLLTEKMLAAEQAGSHCQLINIGPRIRSKIGVTDSRRLNDLLARQIDYSFF